MIDLCCNMGYSLLQQGLGRLYFRGGGARSAVEIMASRRDLSCLEKLKPSQEFVLTSNS